MVSRRLVLLKVKPGVLLAEILTDGHILHLKPPMLVACVVVWSAFDSLGHDCVITSCFDGKHMDKSKHYRGEALDFRTKHVPGPDLARIELKIKDALPGFDVILEDDHLHVEIH